MNFVAVKMLTGDRAKYLGLIFAIAFASFLLENQSSIFAGVMLRTTSQIVDVTDADIWVMDPNTQYIDEIRALTENDLYRVRGVPGVQWAVRLFKGLPRAKAPDGKFRVVILMGLDDATLVGAPGRMLLGSVADLSQPDAIIIDRAGYNFFFPGAPLSLGRTLELHDHRLRPLQPGHHLCRQRTELDVLCPGEAAARGRREGSVPADRSHDGPTRRNHVRFCEANDRVLPAKHGHSR